MSIFWTKAGDKYIKARNAYINARLGPRPSQAANLSYEAGPDEQSAAAAGDPAWEKKYAALEAEWMASLPPADKAEMQRLFAERSSDFDKSFKIGKAAALSIIGAAAGGAALTGAGVIGGGAPAAAAGGIDSATAAAALGGAGEAGAAGAAGSGAWGGVTLPGAASGSGVLTGVEAGAAGAAGAGAAGPTLGSTIAKGAAAVGGLANNAKTAVDAASAAGSLWGSLGAVGTAAAGLWSSYNSSQNVKELLDASAGARAGSMTVAGKQMDMADQNMIQQLALFDQVKPILEQHIKQATEASGLSTQRSNDLWGEYKATWEPLGKTLAQKSLDWASPGRMESEAMRAASDTKSQYDDAMVESRKQLEMSGASQEKIAALEADARLKAAKAIGGAQSTARRDTESKGMAYLDSATRLGLQIPQLGNQTGQLALSQAQQAQSGVGALTAATSIPISSTDALLRGANQSYQTASGQALAGGALTLNNEATKNAGYGDALQAGAKLIGLFGGKP
jgi:hypothetical protein